MILPITAYGHPVLKKVAKDIDKDYPNLDKLIEDMYETMYETNGVGLAAPQINKSIRLFVIDAEPFQEDYPDDNIFKSVFINAQILEEEGEEWGFEEGCLSVPDLHETVMRQPKIKIRYYDAQWQLHEKWIEGIMARVIQHEYDHIEGKLFVERIAPMRKMMIDRKLKKIQKGDISLRYRMIFAPKKQKR